MSQSDAEADRRERAAEAGASPAEPPEPTSVLRHPPFVLYWLARTLANIAWQMQAVAVGWQIYETTNNAFDLGLVGLVEFVPLFAFMLLAGPAADRFDRRRIVQLTQIVQGGAALVLAFGTATGMISKSFILLTVFWFGAGRAFEMPTLATILPGIVPTSLFPKAVATNSTATQIATIAGPALGGVVYAVSPVLVYALCGAFWLISVTMLGFMTMQRRPPSRAPLTLTSVFAGIHYIRRHPVVMGAITLDLFAVLLGGATALLPIYARDIFDTGPWGLGLLRAAPAIGGLSMLVLLARRTPDRGIGKLLFGAVTAFGVSTIVFALSTSFVLSLLALVVLGASDSISVVMRSTLVQLETTDEMRGRVSAVNSLFIGTSNQLGEFRAGTMAGFFGAVPAVIVGGIGTLAVVAACIKLFPELYRIQSFPPQRREPLDDAVVGGPMGGP